MTKEDRQIPLTVFPYREKPLASHEFAIKALRATAAKREARDAEEQEETRGRRRRIVSFRPLLETYCNMSTRKTIRPRLKNREKRSDLLS